MCSTGAWPLRHGESQSLRPHLGSADPSSWDMSTLRAHNMVHMDRRYSPTGAGQASATLQLLSSTSHVLRNVGEGCIVGGWRWCLWEKVAFSCLLVLNDPCLLHIDWEAFSLDSSPRKFIKKKSFRLKMPVVNISWDTEVEEASLSLSLSHGTQIWAAYSHQPSSPTQRTFTCKE